MFVRVRVGEMVVSASEKKAVKKVLDSNQLSPGLRVKEFEEVFSKAHGAKFGVMVNSGTDALRIALGAMKEVYGWHDGDPVVVPALTFVATVNVVLQNKLRPVFVDIEPFGYGMDREALYYASQGAVCMMPVHLFGRPWTMKGNLWPYSVMAIAKYRGTKVLEDSCECMGVSGLMGDVACYSTYVCHLISTGVGGMAITKNRELEQVMRSLANHGRNIDHIPGHHHSKDIRKRFVFDRIGYSSRPTEVEATLGLEQLKKLPAFIKSRRAVVKRLINGLEQIPRIRQHLFFPDQEEIPESAWMMFPMMIQSWDNTDKWDLCEFLEKHGVETRELMPLINQPCYKELGINPRQFPNAERANQKGFYIGCHPGMDKSDTDHVVETFKQFF